MMDNNYSSFRSTKFKKLLSRYENMLSDGKKVYFESDELILLAEYYANNNNVFLSNEVVEYGLTLHPDNLDLVILKAHNLISKGFTDQAEALISSHPDPNDYELQLLKAELLLIRGQREEGITLLSSLYDEDPDIEVALDIAQVYMDVHMKQEGKEWLFKACRQNPDSIEVLEMVASYHFACHQINKAIEIYNKLIDLDPYCLEFWQNLIRCHIRDNNPQKALEAVDFAMTIDNKDLINWELKSHILFMLNDDEEGLRCMEHIEREAKDKTFIRTAMLIRYYLAEKYQKAIEYSTKLIDSTDLEPEEKAAAYHKRAIAHLILNQTDDCLKDIEAGMRLDPYNGDLYTTQGEYFLHIGETDKAGISFSQALAITSYEEETLDGIAYAYLRNRKVEKALHYFQEKERKYPSSSYDNLYFIAYCHYILQHKEKTYQYLIRGSYHCLETVLKDSANLFPDKENLQDFFQLVETVSSQVHNGEIDPKPYLLPQDTEKNNPEN